MPIELRCTKCDTLLRVPDGNEGRETRCPSCQTMLLIPSPELPPAEDADAPSPAVPDGRSPQQEANPFAAPTTTPQIGFGDGVSPFAGGAPVRLDIAELLTRTFSIYRRNAGSCLAAGAIIYYAPLAVLSALIGPVKAIQMSAGGFLAPPLNPDDLPTFLIAMAINLPIFMFLLAGLCLFCLQLARAGGGPAGLLFSGASRALPVFATYFMFSIAMAFGLLLCCVPGFWIAIVFSQVLWLVVDGRAGILDCFGTSMNLTAGHRLNLLWLMLIVGGPSFILGLIPYAALILQPILYPIILILGAVVYLTLSGQSVAGGPTHVPGSVSTASPSGGATHDPGDAPSEPPVG